MPLPPDALSHASPVWLRRRRDLIEAGWTDRALAAAVRSGAILRPRMGVYLPHGTDVAIVDACATGGRLACVSALVRLGVFVLDHPDLHVHLHENREVPLGLSRAVRRHWGRLHRAPHPRAIMVEVLDAVAQSVRCQPPRAAIATLDSALHLGVLRGDDVDDLFALLPRRFEVLRALIDPRAESDPETFVRLLLRSLGVPFDVQVQVEGVGRVDFVVDGWLIIECDSQQFHSSWDDQRRDRRRDQAAAARGYTTYRPIAEDILWHVSDVRAALVGLLADDRLHGHEAMANRSKGREKLTPPCRFEAE